MQGKLYKVFGLSAAAIVLAALAFGTGAVAEKAKAPPACRTIKVEADCTARDDCTWVAATISKKTGKETRKAYCRSKPKTTKKS